MNDYLTFPMSVWIVYHTMTKLARCRYGDGSILPLWEL